MSIGRTFKESLQKAVRSLENDTYGFEEIANASPELIKSRLKTPGPERLWYIAQALRDGMGVKELHELTWVDPWFLSNMSQIIEHEVIDRAVADLPDWSFEIIAPETLSTCDPQKVFLSHGSYPRYPGRRHRCAAPDYSTLP